MGAITSKEVYDVAKLARLGLADDEASRLQRELASILAYVEKLSMVDTTGVEPMTHPVPQSCPLRSDSVAPSLAAEEALANAPRRHGDYFAVPRIIDIHGDKKQP
ncbi:MAG: Asp-tRNA(Asn)/Glu-tRNA(Gln) amidotransferase subunit GatC [Pseudomonadota bacterium]